MEEYSIADYDELYRPYDKSGRELVHADWVKLPANPKGDGLQELLEHKQGLEVFGIWCLLLEKTTREKPENRGKLLNRKEEPASIEEIAKSISLKRRVKLVEYALNLLKTMGWLKGGHNVPSLRDRVSPKSSVLKGSVVKGKAGQFVPPTISQINEYCREKNIYVDAKDFIDFYANKDWEIGKTEKKMKDWRLAANRAVKWECNRDKQPPPKPKPDPKLEAERLEKRRQQIRDEDGSYYREKTTKELKEDLKSYGCFLDRWLIAEILAEREGKK